MSNKQQTSVDTIIKFMEDNQYFIGNDLYEFLKQAKEMEKEQIINAVDGFPLRNRNLNGTEYYNETYGGNK